MSWFKMETSALQKVLEDMVLTVLAARGVELVELVVSGGQRRKLVRLYVDRPEGITIGECAEISRAIADVLDARNPISGTYLLEVSSPGLTRVLASDRDFERAVGKSVKLVVDGQGTLIGVLQGVQTGHLDVVVDGQLRLVERVRIQKANLHIDF